MGTRLVTPEVDVTCKPAFVFQIKSCVQYLSAIGVLFELKQPRSQCILGFIYVTDGRQRIPWYWLMRVPPLRGGTYQNNTS